MTINKKRSKFEGVYSRLLASLKGEISNFAAWKLKNNIAQIFLKKPEILILDEATSALDTK